MRRFAHPAVAIAPFSAALLYLLLVPDHSLAQRSAASSAESGGNPFRESLAAEWSPNRNRISDAAHTSTSLPPSAHSLASVKGSTGRAARSSTSQTASSGPQHQRRKPAQPMIVARSMDRPQLRGDHPTRQVASQRTQPLLSEPGDDGRWLLPNEMPTRTASHAAPSSNHRSDGHHQTISRSDQVTNRAPREPRQFTPSDDARRMSASGSNSHRARSNRRTTNRPSSDEPSMPVASEATMNKRATQAHHGIYSGSSAVVSASTATNEDALLATRPSDSAQSQHEVAPSSPHSTQLRRNSHRRFSVATRTESFADQFRRRMRVALQGPEAWAAYEGDEELPIPGANISQSEPAKPIENVPMLQEDGGYEVIDGPVFSDGYAGCSDGICYGEAGYGCVDGMCPCGGACEPGCGCGPSCGCGNCGSTDLFCAGCGDDESCQTVRIRIPKWQELMLFAGVQGFKGPYDQSRDSGNFGFHQGFNAGFKVPHSSMGYQIGYQAVESQLSGDKDTDTADPHTQQFVTAGLFQRTRHGFQWGAVWDVLRDERWGAVDFHQIRAEISYIDNGCHEIGFTGAFHLDEYETPRQDADGTALWRATDQYLLFYRFHGRRGGEGRFYAGLNDDSDAIIGSDMMLPLTDRWSLQPGFTYLIPDEDGGAVGASQEAWNIGIAMIWHWDCRARSCHSSRYRPLFNVANNGYLIVDDRPGSAAP